jgi:hypothetical protein
MPGGSIPAAGARDDASTKPTLYAVLGLDASATPAQIKRAYHRRALKCHPDKHANDPEKTREFQAISAAYGVLKDEKKRRVYDRVGEEGVRMMEQGVQSLSPEAVAAMIGQAAERATPRQKAGVLCALCTVLGFVALAPAFVAMRADDDVRWSWAWTLAPLWVMDVFGLLCCATCVQSLFEGPPDEAGLTPEQARQHVLGAVSFSLGFALGLAQQILLVLRLDGHVHWSWPAVLAPWLALELLWLVLGCAGAEARYVVFADVRAADRANVRRAPEFWTFAGAQTVGGLARAGLCLLLGQRLQDGASGPGWGTVFAPVWAGLALRFLWHARRWQLAGRRDARRRREGGGAGGGAGATGADDADMSDSRSVVCASIVQDVLVGASAGLLLAKCSGADFSAFVVYLPFAAPLLCVCCALCCGAAAGPLPPEGFDGGDDRGGPRGKRTGPDQRPEADGPDAVDLEAGRKTD